MKYLSRFSFFPFVYFIFLNDAIAQPKEIKPAHERAAIVLKEINISPLNPAAGDEIKILVIIADESEVPTGEFKVQVTVDKELVGTETVSLEGYAAKTISFKWKAHGQGLVYINAIADPDNKIDETEKSDNFSFLPLNIEAGKVTITKEKRKKDSTLSASADILISDVSVLGHLFQEGRKRMVTVNFKITNHSTENINTPFQAKIIAEDKLGFRKEFTINVPKLQAGQTTFAAVTIQDAPHQFDITINADPNNTVHEANKNNNTVQTYFENPVPPINRWISAGPDYIDGVGATGYPWNNATGQLGAIIIHPVQTQMMMVGSAFSGIWKTDDGGASWYPLTDKISTSVAALTFSPRNPDKVYWVTAKQGVYQSDDDGNSWTQISNQNLNALVPAGKLLIHPRDENIMLVKSFDGVYRSSDGGANWTQVISGGACIGLEILPGTDMILASITSRTNAAVVGIYVSYDRGINWTKMAGCPGGSLPANATLTNITLAQSGGTFYAAYRTSTTFQLYRTTNISCSVGGRQEFSWEKAWSTTSSADVLWGQLWTNPSDPNSLYLGGTAFWRSTNKGSSFSKVSDYGTSSGSAHADHHGFAALPGQSNTIFDLNDGGIYQSTQNGNEGSWSFIGKGISNVLFYDFADAFTKPDLLLGGTQDNGTIKTDGNLTWTAKLGGDGATVDIDNTNENIMYAMNQYASSIQRSSNGGSNWSNFSNGLPDGAVCFNIRYHLHPRNMNILLASCSQLWRITDPAGSWQVLFTPASGGVNCSAVEPTSDTYLAGISNGKIFAGVYGNNFQEIFAQPYLMGVADIECDLDDPSITYAGFGGAGAGRVYRLKKSGANYSPTDITSDLPVGLQVQCLAVDRMNPFTIYAGTPTGVYRGRSFDKGVTWTWDAYMEGLPLADIRDLEVHPVTGVMRAATFGRSLFEVSTNDPLGSVLAVEGKINYLRIHDAGTKFGPPNDVLDAEAIISLDTKPGYYFGIQLRNDANQVSATGSLTSLRAAFETNTKVRIEYIRNGLRSGRIIRVIRL